VQTSALTLTSDQIGRLTSGPQKAPGDAYLKFEIAQGIQAVISMHQVQEVLVLPMQRLTAMPNLPASILGLTHRRSRVLWVADLAKLLEIGSLDSSPRQYDLMILRTTEMAIAAAVQRVDGILWVAPETIQPPPSHIAVSLIAYLRGCILQSQDFLLVLDAESILQSAVFQGHQASF
jgi:positive phototaxis protein PixI